MVAATTPGEQRKRADDVVSAVVILVIGLATGALTLVGQKYLPNGLSQFANSYSMWLAAAFLAGMFVRRESWAWAGGPAVELLALVGYYVTSFAVLGETADDYLHATLFWVIGGILAGPFLGGAGYAWRRRRGWAPLAACSLLSGMFLSEGFYVAGKLDYDIGYAFMVIGVAIALVLPRTWPRRFVAFCGGLALGAILYGIYAAVFLPLYEHL